MLRTPRDDSVSPRADGRPRARKHALSLPARHVAGAAPVLTDAQREVAAARQRRAACKDLSHLRAAAQWHFSVWLRYACLRNLLSVHAECGHHRGEADRLRRCRDSAASQRYSDRRSAAASGRLQAWLRWVLLRRVAATADSARAAVAAAAAETAEWTGRVSQLEQCVESSAREQALASARVEELLAERKGLRERVKLLERGLAEARQRLAASAEAHSSTEIDLEGKCAALTSEVGDLRRDVEHWRREATQGVEAAKLVFDTKAAGLSVECEEQRSAAEESRRQCDALRVSASAVTAEAGSVRRQLAECLSRERELREEQRRAEELLRLQIASRDERISSLEKYLSTTRGEVEELEQQVDGRSAELSRLSSEMAALQDSLAGETEIRHTVERALHEAQQVHEAQVTGLSGDLETVRITAQQTAAELDKSREAAEHWEEVAANLRGQVLQQERNRELLGTLSEHGLCVADAGGTLQEQEEAARRLRERLEREHSEALQALEAEAQREREAKQQAVAEAATLAGDVQRLTSNVGSLQEQVKALSLEAAAVARQHSDEREESARVVATHEQRAAAEERRARVADRRLQEAEAEVRAAADVRCALEASRGEAESLREQLREAERHAAKMSDDASMAGAAAEGRALRAEVRAQKAEEMVQKMQGEVLLAQDREHTRRRSDSTAALSRQDSALRLHRELAQAQQEVLRLQARVSALESELDQERAARCDGDDMPTVSSISALAQHRRATLPQVDEDAARLAHGGESDLQRLQGLVDEGRQAEAEVRRQLTERIAECQRMQQELAEVREMGSMSMSTSTAAIGSPLAAARERLLADRDDEIDQLRNELRMANYIKSEVEEEVSSLQGQLETTRAELKEARSEPSLSRQGSGSSLRRGSVAPQAKRAAAKPAPKLSLPAAGRRPSTGRAAASPTSPRLQRGASQRAAKPATPASPASLATPVSPTPASPASDGPPPSDGSDDKA